MKKNKFLIDFLLFISGSALFFFSQGFQTHYYLIWFGYTPFLLFSYYNNYIKTFFFSFFAIVLCSLCFYEFFSFSTFALIKNFEYIFIYGMLISFNRYCFRNIPWSRLFIFPSIMTFVEYSLPIIFNISTLSSFSYTQYKFLPIIQLASVTGTYGITFLIIFVSNATALCIYYFLKKQHKKAITTIFIAIFVFLSCLIFGMMRIKFHKNSNPEKFTVGVLSLVSLNLDLKNNTSDNIDEFIKKINNHLSLIQKIKEKNIKIIIIPEKIQTTNSLQHAEVIKLLSNAANKYNVQIIIGLRKGLDYVKQSNSAWIFSPNENITGICENCHLIPNYEKKSPFKNIELTKKSLFIPLKENDKKFGIAICRDMEVQKTSLIYAKSNVSVIFIPALDHFHKTSLWSRIAIFRGIEGGFSTIRSIKKGMLIVSNMTGDFTIIETNKDKPYYVFSAPFGTNETIYLKYGNWFIYLCVLLIITTLFIAAIFKKSQYPSNMLVKNK